MIYYFLFITKYCDACHIINIQINIKLLIIKKKYLFCQNIKCIKLLNCIHILFFSFIISKLFIISYLCICNFCNIQINIYLIYFIIKYALKIGELSQEIKYFVIIHDIHTRCRLQVVYLIWRVYSEVRRQPMLAGLAPQKVFVPQRVRQHVLESCSLRIHLPA